MRDGRRPGIEGKLSAFSARGRRVLRGSGRDSRRARSSSAPGGPRARGRRVSDLLDNPHQVTPFGGGIHGQSKPFAARPHIGEDAGRVFMKMKKGLGLSIEDSRLSFAYTFQLAEFPQHRLNEIEGCFACVLHTRCREPAGGYPSDFFRILISSRLIF